MLDHVAPTFGYGYSVYFIAVIFRCPSTEAGWLIFGLTYFILVIALTTFGFGIKFGVERLLDFPPWYGRAVTAFFTLSLSVNTLVTPLIVYKIVTVYHDIRGFDNRNVQTRAYGSGQRDLYPLISILVESGLMTFVGQLTQSIMYETTIPGFPLISGSVVMLFVRASFSIVGLVL